MNSFIITALVGMSSYVYGHLAEYLIHRFVLHKHGLKKSSLLSFHFSNHHKSSRVNGFIDKSYSTFYPKWDAAGKEIFYLFAILLLHIPMLLVSKIFYIVLVISVVEYYYKHRRSHTNPEWAKRNVPWHYDHHMGKNQHLNWGVRSSIFDNLFGTRKVYFNTKE